MVSRSFLITILDDNLVEQDEVFQVVLSTPEGGGSVGPQFRANVTIIDNDRDKISPKLTRSYENTTVSVAGKLFTVTINAASGTGDLLSTGGERFFAAIENNLAMWDSLNGRRQTGRKTCAVEDYGTGAYGVHCAGIAEQGDYQLRTWHAFPNALRGEYYSDAFFQNLVITRLDRVVNFTWGDGSLIPKARDYVTIRWSGAILTDSAGIYKFLVNADDQARLWINGELILDHFQERQVNLQPSRALNLSADSLYEIVLEYREINGPAFAQLMWKTPGATIFAVIPSSNLYSLFEIDLSPILVTIKSDETFANTTECYGEGLYAATALQTSYFTVCPRDQYGNLRNDGDLVYLATQPFSATFTLIDDEGYGGFGAEIVTPVLVFNTETSCFDGYYVPQRAGTYELSILFQNSSDAVAIDIAGSPFYLHVEPGQSFGPLSDVWGLPSPLYATAGSCYNFDVTMRDRNRNLRLVGGDNIQVGEKFKYHSTVQYLIRFSLFRCMHIESITSMKR